MRTCWCRDSVSQRYATAHAGVSLPSCQCEYDNDAHEASDRNIDANDHQNAVWNSADDDEIFDINRSFAHIDSGSGFHQGKICLSMCSGRTVLTVLYSDQHQLQGRVQNDAGASFDDYDYKGTHAVRSQVFRDVDGRERHSDDHFYQD